MEERKLYLNIQEQVEKNRKDIKDMQEGVNILASFGIKVIGQVDDASELPDPAEYDGDFGDAFIVGTENPYDYYIFTRAFEGQDEPSWFNIGEFPLPGPQGPQGETGATGHTPQVTVATPVTYTLPAGVNATVSVTNIGTADDPMLGFTFGIPKGDKGDTGAQGSPGAFNIKGQVNSADLLPSASDVDPTAAYAVGSTLPYDIYVIMTVNDEQSWLNLGPVLTEISDTILISNSYDTSGTLSAEQLLAIANDTNMNFLKIGNQYFSKMQQASGGSKYLYGHITIDESNIFNLRILSIDSVTGAWTISTKTVVDETSEQYISGIKHFSNGLASSKITTGASDLIVDMTGVAVRPNVSSSGDLGTPTYQWRDLFLAGKINANSLTYGLTLPSTTSFTADKVIATTDQAFNVINATDIVSNTLSQDQYDLITNGKPTLIKGTFLNAVDGIYYYCGNFPTNAAFRRLSRRTSDGYFSERNVLVNLSTLVVTEATTNEKLVDIYNVRDINGKTIPNYPSDTGTFVLKCVNGVLTWVAE